MGSHPLYAISNCLISNEINKHIKTKKLAFVRKYDYETYFIAYSFGIRDFIFVDDGNFFIRAFYFIKAIGLIPEKNLKKNLINLKYKNFFIGKVAYEHTLRNFIKKSITKKENYLFYISISRAIYAIKKYEKFFDNKSFHSFVLGELQYIPYRIFYNLATKKKYLYTLN